MSSPLNNKLPETVNFTYALVIGDKEVADNKVTVESRDSGNLGAQSVEDFIEKIKAEIKERK